MDVVKSSLMSDALDPSKRQYKGWTDCVRKVSCATFAIRFNWKNRRDAEKEIKETEKRRRMRSASRRGTQVEGAEEEHGSKVRSRWVVACERLRR